MSDARPWPPGWTVKPDNWGWAKATFACRCENAEAIDKWATQQRTDPWQALLDRAPHCRILNDHLDSWYRGEHNGDVEAFLCDVVLAFSLERERLAAECDRLQFLLDEMRFRD